MRFVQPKGSWLLILGFLFGVRGSRARDFEFRIGSPVCGRRVLGLGFTLNPKTRKPSGAVQVGRGSCEKCLCDKRSGRRTCLCLDGLKGLGVEGFGV